MAEGRFLENAADSGIIIGRKLADTLDTAISKRVVILSQDPDNEIADRGFRVVGLFESETQNLEKSFVFTGIDVSIVAEGMEWFGASAVLYPQLSFNDVIMANVIVLGTVASLSPTGAPPDTPLLWALRDELRLKGTKYGCGIGVCGLCIVHVNGHAQRNCVTTIADVAGQKITTIEGLPPDHPVIRTWIRNATEITSPSDLPYRSYSALRQQFYSWAMRLLSRLEYKQSSRAS